MSGFGGFLNSTSSPQHQPPLFGSTGFHSITVPQQDTNAGMNGSLFPSSNSNVFGGTSTSAFGFGQPASTTTISGTTTPSFSGSGFSNFGNTTTQNQFAGFGSLQQSTATVNNFSFGNGSSSSTTSPASGGLSFGASQSVGNSTPLGILGSPAPSSFPSQVGGGIFGGVVVAPQFGSINTIEQPQQQNPPPFTFGQTSKTTDLGGFGSNQSSFLSNTNTARNAFGNSSNSGFSFGGSISTPVVANSGSGGFFGSQPASTTGGGLFGTINSSAVGAVMNNVVEGSLFGNSSSINNNASFGTLGTPVAAGSNTAPFGGGFNHTTSTPFGVQSQPSASAPIQPFNTSSASNTAQLTSSFSTSTHNSVNPFGGGTTELQPPQNASISFGSSTNVVSSSTSSFSNTGGLFGSSTNYSGSKNTGFNPSFSNSYNLHQHSDLDMRTTSPLPYGSGNVPSSPQSMSPMRSGQSDSEAEMGDGEQENKEGSHLPFGKPVTFGSHSGTTFWGGSASSNDNTSGIGTSLSPVLEMEGSIIDSNFSGNVQVPASVNAHNTRLAELKAKLELKKKKLEQKRKKDDDGKREDMEGEAYTTLSKGGSKTKNSQTAVNSNQFEVNSTDSFGTKTIAESRSQQQQSSTEREELVNAVSLVGTCHSMCPDEEIERRERENDIQLLEKPSPGVIHPPHWTLRDTMVKRFRRSAADYKLDVPEWVRPPDVLENVCGYLEEWVMERDRQGPDQRFIDSEFNFKDDGTPASLDVYQFIWDRTRMVRKDFILQNYVGTGGNCDARAVRCHERIARWHAMCEHQLSHIPEFTTKQSQQNIQELGQTMKTLNQYYDDTMNRSIVEVPDENGNETRIDLSKFNHGCVSNIVAGVNPRDFDQTPLINNDDSSENDSRIRRRLIGGRHAVMSPHHGTAEPEMRGLYILLTLENDGGMEVLKYVARLYQLRPDVYHTAPVQLALNVYKARKEYNYARFFSILRDPCTPYLFACVMFKYVEVMRKLAFRIMCKTYGGKNRENDAIYDEYPLQDLTHLLCFEDDDESRSACRHYNITVKLTDGIENIYWKQSTFKDPKDPDKGITLRLLPRKMIRTIEKKIQGLTRLAICRGEVSGEGAFLVNPQQLSKTKLTPIDRSQQEQERNDARRAEMQRQQMLIKERAEAEAVRRLEEETKLKEMKRKQQEEIERRRLKEEEEMRELEQQRQLQQDKIKREERLRVDQELEHKRRSQEVEAERKRKEEAEHALQQELLRQEELRRQQEALEREKQRVEEQRRMKAEKEQRQRDLQALLRKEEERIRREAEDAEKRQKEEDMIRMEALRREEHEKKRKAIEIVRLQKESQCRIESAKKKIALLRWMKILPRRIHIEERTLCGLNRISSILEPGFSLPIMAHAIQEELDQCIKKASTDLRGNIESLLKQERDFSTQLMSSIANEYKFKRQAIRSLRTKTTLLFKIGVIAPISHIYEAQVLSDLIRTWINSRLHFGRVTTFESDNVDVRVLVVDSHDKQSHSHCDAVMFVLPWLVSDASTNIESKERELEAMDSSVDEDIPRVVFAVHEKFHPRHSSRVKNLVGSMLSGSFEEVHYVENKNNDPQILESCLSSTCELLAKVVGNNEPYVVERMTFGRLALSLLLDDNWFLADDGNRDRILTQACLFLQIFFNELDSTVTEVRDSGNSWPPLEFATDRHRILDYFESGHDLRIDWMSSLSQENVHESLAELLYLLRKPFEEVIWALLRNASFSVQRKCQRLLDQGTHVRCFRMALEWKVENDDKSVFDQIVYINRVLMQETLQTAITKFREQTMHGRPKGVQTRQDHMATEEIVVHSEEFDIEQSLNGKWNEYGRNETPSLLDDDVKAHSSLAELVVEQPDPSPEMKEQQQPQRRRKASAVQDSMNYTKRLKQMLDGELCHDMLIGSFTLRSALKDAAPLSSLSSRRSSMR